MYHYLFTEESASDNWPLKGVAVAVIILLVASAVNFL